METKRLPFTESMIGRYAMATAGVLLVGLVRLALEPVLLHGAPYILSIPAVVFAAWYCGFGPAVLATVLGGALGVVIQDPATWRAYPGSGIAGLGLYGVASLWVMLLAEEQRNAKNRAAREVEARLDAEEKFGATLNSVDDGVIAVDVKGLVTYMNPVAEYLTGWNRNEAEGRACSEVFRIFGEESREELANPASMVLTEAPTALCEKQTVLIAKDGRELPVDASGAPIRDAKDNLTGAVLVFRDTAERRRTERALARSRNELQAIYDNSPTLMCLLDEDREVIHVNQAFRRFVGAGTEWEVRGKIGNIVGCIGSTTDPRGCGYGERCAACLLRDRIADTATTGERHEGIEHRMELKDGREVFLSGTTVAIETDGRHDMLLCLQDITQLRRAEADLRRINESLEKRVEERTSELNDTLRELESFCYHVAHDFRAPLRSIVATSRMLADGAGPKLEDEERDFLERQENAALKLSKLIDSLLEYARIGRLGWEMRPIDVTEMARKISEQVSTTYPGRSLRFDIEEGLVATGDASMVRILIGNLFDNAAKYSPSGGLISVRSEPKLGAFAVSDQGIGFEPEYAERIFLPFERLHRDHEYRGTGIGLASARRIAERHGGSIWAFSEGPGKGSTFYFTLQNCPETRDPEACAG